MTKLCVTTMALLIFVLPYLGCEKPNFGDSQGSSPTANEDGWIVSDKNLTIENGKITEGRLTVTEDVEREIYKSLNHRRKMIASIKKNSGSARGIQQMQDEFELLSKGFMTRYDLTQGEIDAILAKGDSNGWK